LLARYLVIAVEIHSNHNIRGACVAIPEAGVAEIEAVAGFVAADAC